MPVQPDALDILKRTSRTFFIPISRLPVGLREAITSAYLCMRAVDEIEDHPALDPLIKVRQLRAISQLFQAQTTVAAFSHPDFAALFSDAPADQPEVTLRLSEWACLAPESIAPRIWDSIAAMAERMAFWVENGWTIHTQADLDRYTFGVAGAVGLLICDIGAWNDGFQMSRTPAIQFGRGLQAVNILRNRAADVARGVDFFPIGWTPTHMTDYARGNLALAHAYAQTLPTTPFAYFIQIPLALAIATLDTLDRGEEKLSRSAVESLVQLLTPDDTPPAKGSLHG